MVKDPGIELQSLTEPGFLGTQETRSRSYLRHTEDERGFWSRYVKSSTAVDRTSDVAHSQNISSEGPTVELTLTFCNGSGWRLNDLILKTLLGSLDVKIVQGVLQGRGRFDPDRSGSSGWLVCLNSLRNSPTVQVVQFVSWVSRPLLVGITPPPPPGSFPSLSSRTGDPS